MSKCMYITFQKWGLVFNLSVIIVAHLIENVTNTSFNNALLEWESVAVTVPATLGFLGTVSGRFTEQGFRLPCHKQQSLPEIE